MSQVPRYSGDVGTAWLARGGVYVVANIRGGGEFGPRWHEAAMREKHQNNFDDLVAVAEDLVSRKITSPDHLGIEGGSPRKNVLNEFSESTGGRYFFNFVNFRDPLAQINLTGDDFDWATGKLMDMADQYCDNRLVSVLEGGYDLAGLSSSVGVHVKALMHGTGAAAQPVDEDEY